MAFVSAGALGWLGWLLLEQDASLEVQHRQNRLEQAVDRAAAMRRSSTRVCVLECAQNSVLNEQS